MARYWLANHKAGFRQRKARCPQCGKQRLTRYFDRRNGELLPDEYGRCERINSCGYDHDPNHVLSWHHEEDYKPKPLPPPRPERTDWRCPEAVFNSTFRDHCRNNLMTWLTSLYGECAHRVLMDYRVGTYMGKRVAMHGAAMFWQIDRDGGIRTGHAILYSGGGKRDRTQRSDDCWAHHGYTGKSLSDLGGAECFFGEHLITERPDALVCIVESEKTALVCAVNYPGAVWLASGGANKVSRQKIRALKGRDVILFPDLGQEDLWTRVAEELDAYFLTEGSLRCSTALRRFCSAEEYERGDDLADFLVPENRLIDVDVFETPAVAEVVEPGAPTPTMSAWQQLVANNPALMVLRDELDLDTGVVTITPL